jgi:hypothetical protein
MIGMVGNFFFDQKKAQSELLNFFKKEKANVNSFGSKVNQTFEAEVFAKVIKKYSSSGWSVTMVNPIIYGKPEFKLKFNTRGAPVNYSYVRCKSIDGRECQIRHGLRVQTKYNSPKNKFSANIVCDIVVMRDLVIDHYTSSTALPWDQLIAFGEVKHMSAFAELIASFIGMVYEIQPHRLKRIRNKSWSKPDHVSSFLYVSGKLNPTAEGILETILKRKFDVDIYSYDKPI